MDVRVPDRTSRTEPALLVRALTLLARIVKDW